MLEGVDNRFFAKIYKMLSVGADDAIGGGSSAPAGW
jgi:hypothetical protein